MTVPVTARLKLDAKRRPTIPTALLDAAGVGPGQDLVARVEGPGRIVLESSAAILAQLQATVAAGRAPVTAAPVPPADAPKDSSSGQARQASEVSESSGQEPASLVDQLFAERAADTALEHDALKHDQP